MAVPRLRAQADPLAEGLLLRALHSPGRTDRQEGLQEGRGTQEEQLQERRVHQEADEGVVVDAVRIFDFHRHDAVRRLQGLGRPPAGSRGGAQAMDESQSGARAGAGLGHHPEVEEGVRQVQKQLAPVGRVLVCCLQGEVS